MGQTNRPGSPAGRRADIGPRRARRAGLLIGALLLAVCFSVGIGGETAKLRVENLTPHLVDVTVADRSFRNVAPGASATYASSGAATVVVGVSYAAGQGVEGTAQRSFYLADGGPAYGTTVYWACFTSSGPTAPAVPGPVYWKVTPDTLGGR